MATITTKKPMGENTKKVLAFLQETGVGVKLTAKEAMTALGFDKVAYVTGTVTALVKRGLVERFKEEEEDENGKIVKKSYFALTEAGAAFDINSEE